MMRWIDDTSDRAECRPLFFLCGLPNRLLLVEKKLARLIRYYQRDSIIIFSLSISLSDRFVPKLRYCLHSATSDRAARRLHGDKDQIIGVEIGDRATAPRSEAKQLRQASV